MSIVLDISERRLKLGILKLGITMAAAIALIGFIFSLLVGNGQDLALSIFMISIAFTALTNGFLALLKVFDWFEARKHRHG